MPRFSLSSEGFRSSIVFDDGHMNLLSAEALGELGGTFAEVPAETRLLTFRSGRARLFAAGADMEVMRRFTAVDADRFSQLGQKTFASIAAAPFATAVLIDGDCFGGALDLCLAFDLRIASVRSRFAHPGGRIGIVTGFAGTVRLPRIASRPGTAKLLLGNQLLSAEEAREAGVVDATVDSFNGAEEERLRPLESLDRATLEVCRLLESEPSLDAPAALLLARRTAQLHSAARN